MQIKSVSVIEHFDRIARDYRSLRVTDPEPVEYLAKLIRVGDPITNLLDIGCGTGRYIEVLLDRLHTPVNLCCLDLSNKMLSVCRKVLANHSKTKSCCFIKCSANSISFKQDVFDCVITFNAIHHFDLSKFLSEVILTLKENGILAIYTRSRAQNENTIWGKFFPKFSQKETRLFSIDEFENIIYQNPRLDLEEIKIYNFERLNTLAQLIKSISNHHYSTFEYYTPEKLAKASIVFENRLRKIYGKHKIPHVSRYTLYILRKKRA
ncbi:MAG: class I SAM-dependent methyltransferase [candidate division Zixibacteria bacterium]